MSDDPIDTYKKAYQYFESIDDPQNVLRKDFVRDIGEVTGTDFLNNSDFMTIAKQNSKNITPEDAMSIISEIQESPQLSNVAKKAVSKIESKIKKAALSSGEKDFVKTYDDLSRLQKVKNDVMKKINTRFESDEMAIDKGQAFFRELSRKSNKSGWNDFKDKVESLIGKDVLIDYDLYRVAEDYGDRLPLFNQMPTGASLRGLSAAGGVGGAALSPASLVAGAAGIGATMPPVAAAITGALDSQLPKKAITKMSDVMQRRSGVSPMEAYQALKARGVAGIVGE